MSDPSTPTSGSIPYSIGIAGVVRIPIPGTPRLGIKLRPCGAIPKNGSTSTLFFQDISGRKHLRLDYGYNVQTKTVDYHWNQRGTHERFGIADHTPVGQGGATVYRSAKYFRHAGRVLAIVDVSIDVVSIVVASRPIRRASEVVTGLALSWAGCKATGAAGALAGTPAAPFGVAAGGLAGCVVGGYIGYQIGSVLGGAVFDWSDATFSPLPQARL
ncbi:hypothetical protein [Burkholderia ubonensis]|uniref:Uncharacterized protein n=1 Tax=Burkholderia ubonensis subsp. mesacidophila TaxID=265293 RepID=A0A2A4F9M7_9BURK|nr:hypothetical protein [Burkholderia ubonensis]PCE29116.1 hypothetical protein BZL54_28165 [Burkholderia ubonensis subsp. mesacidophila]